ncbi:response regulator transcription factor [Dermatophilus congolensis]|uniref:response regulator transcription factor n=1 Tax=Dermatophilus congolensis TaxID=1863 RepID=UPI00312C98F7
MSEARVDAQARCVQVVLTDDHPIVRAGLRVLVDSQPDMRVVADFATAEELGAWVRGGGVADVLLVDLRFGQGRMNGAQATAQLVAGGAPPVLVLTTYDTDGEILAAIEAGATGYLLKDSPTEELTAAIRAAAAGEVTLGPTVQRRLVARMAKPTAQLSVREREVLGLVAEGAGNDAIAAALFLSKATVKTHLAHIYDKLGVKSRTAAVAAARRQGLIEH